MEPKACALLAVLLAHCICIAFVTAEAPEEDYNQLDTKALTIASLEKRLKEDIAREIQDVLELERQLQGNLFKLQAKKRQLEIKKRTPVQCLVNIVSCWRRK